MASPRVAAVIANLALGLGAFGQMRVGTATFTWQGSTDGGASWEEGSVSAAPNSSVLMRSVVAWSAVPHTGHAFGTVRFDVAVSDSGEGDAVGGMGYGPYGTGVPSTVAATRFGSTIKIDDVRDTLPPGLGGRTVQPSQLTPQIEYPIDLRNPAPVFYFRVDVDGTEGTRTVSAIFAPPVPGGNDIDRFVFLYYDVGGANNLPLSTYGGHFAIRVVPSPGGCGVVVFGVVWGCSRRRGRDSRWVSCGCSA